MNAARIRALMDSFTGVGRKVLDAIPVQDWWTRHQIIGEVRRAHGTAPAVDVVDRILIRGQDQGIVKKRGDTYQRLCPAMATSEITEEENEDMPTPLLDAVRASAAPPLPEDPFDRAAELIGRMERLLREFNETVLAMQSRVEHAKMASARFRELQKLLRED